MIKGFGDGESFSDKLSTPLENLVDVIVESTFNSNADIIGKGLTALQKAGVDIHSALNFLRKAYVALEMRATSPEYTNLVLKRRLAAATGEKITHVFPIPLFTNYFNL